MNLRESMDVRATEITRGVVADLARRVQSEWPKHFSEADLTPDSLATYFTLARVSARLAPEFSETLAQKLLDFTVRRAAEVSPFHRDRLKHLPEIITPTALTALPLMSRADLAGDMKVAVDDRDFDFASYTSGTTSQRPLILDRSNEEQEFVRRFGSIINPESMRRDNGVALRLVNNWHGQLVDFPSAYHIVPVASGNLTALRTARDLLLRTFKIGGREQSISVIGGPLSSMLRLTGFLHAEGVRDKLPPIATIQSTSEFLTTHNRQLLESFWNCKVADRFGATESFMGAWSCPECGHYHPEPYGVTEFVALHSDEPVTSGRGRLVYTGFYPWMQMLPLVRYATGDAVAISDQRCPAHPLGYKPLGRMSDGFHSEKSGYVGSLEIIDILDSEPGIFRDTFFPWLPSHIRQVGAPPSFRFFAAEDEGCGIEIGIAYDPFRYAEHAEDLRRRIDSRLKSGGIPVREIRIRQVKDARTHEIF